LFFETKDVMVVSITNSHDMVTNMRVYNHINAAYENERRVSSLWKPQTRSLRLSLMISREWPCLRWTWSSMSG